MFPITVSAGFLLVATFELVAGTHARKEKALLHQKVTLFSIGNFGKIGIYSIQQENDLYWKRGTSSERVS